MSDSDDKYLGMGTASFLTDDNADGIKCLHCDVSWPWDDDESGPAAFTLAGRHYREVHAGNQIGGKR